MIDVIFPTVPGREDSLARCVASYEQNTAPDAITITVIRGQDTVGKAWIEGMAKTSEPFVHLSCDDIEMASPTWAAACVEVASDGKLPAPIVRRPDGSVESAGGDMNRAHCLIEDIQADGTEVDFTPLPFMSREQADQIGMIEAHYMTDVFVSYKGRQFGYPTVVTHGYEVTHHHENPGRRTVTAEDHVLFNAAL
jgi:uncharacterized protein (DUF736 family)